MLNISLCDNKNQQQTLYDIHNRFSKCPPFAATQTRRRLRPTPFLHLSAGWGISSPRARAGRPRAADTRDADFIPLSLWPPNCPNLHPVDYTVWCVLRSESTERRFGLWRSCSSALRGSGNACNRQSSEAVAYKHLRACVAANML